jgi:AcrR family transcriptional regulator
MFQNQEPMRRSRGRPQVRSDDETRRLVIDAAAKEFQANGYAGTSMGAVAQRAGVSTKTLYRLIPTKSDLFGQVVTHRVGDFMLAFDDVALDTLAPAEALERILTAYGNLTLQEETIAMNRLVIGESDRFPEVAAAFHLNAIVPTTQALTAWLTRQCARGIIRLDDALMAAGMLRGMMIMDVQRTVILRQRAAPDAAEISLRARACAAMFLRGCLVRN